MAVFRHHLLGIVLFPFGVSAMVIPLSMAVLYTHPQYVAFPMRTLGPVAVVVGVAAVLGLTLYHTDIARRRAEWVVLAPVLALALVVAMHANNVAGNLLWGPRSVIRSPGTVERAVFMGTVFLVSCLACAALASWWMKGFPRAIPAGGLKRELLALVILIPLSLWPRTVTALIADRLGWGVGKSIGEVFEDAHLRYALGSGLVLAAIAVPYVLIAALLWRGRPPGSRWCGTALISTWVAVSSWLGQMYRFEPHLDYDNWLQAAVMGVAAGGVALAYVHGVVVPMWRRTQRAAGPEAAAAEPAAPPGG
jgi:hypothetical protein